MLYLKLNQPYRDFNKIEIKSFQFIETHIEFIYTIYKNTSGIKSTLTDKNIVIVLSPKITAIKNTTNSSLSIYDGVCKTLLTYLINENIESGTIEVE